MCPECAAKQATALRPGLTTLFHPASPIPGSDTGEPSVVFVLLLYLVAAYFVFDIEL